MSADHSTDQRRRTHDDVTEHAGDVEADRPSKLLKLHELSPPVFPVGVHSYLDINADPNAFYVDKTSFIPVLERIGKAVILLAPRRFGKSLLLDTLACYYDIKRATTFKDDFGKRWIGQENVDGETKPRKTKLANTFYVLRLDFSRLSQAHTFDQFNKSLNELIDAAIKAFCIRYPEVRDPPIAGDPPFTLCDNSILSFSDLLENHLAPQNRVMMLLIDEYDYFLNSVIGNQEFARSPEEINRMEFTFKAFFSTVKSCLGPNLRVFIAGVTPMALSMFTSGFNVALNNLQDAQCPKLFGFTEQDVHEGLRGVSLASDFQQAILATMKALHDGYKFHSSEQTTLFNPSRAQFVLHQLSRYVQVKPGASVADLKDYVANLTDPNTKPAEAVLTLVASNPHTFDIVTDCINYPEGFSSSMKSLDYQIRPSSMLEVDKQGRNAVISWMFFTGALTYAPSGTDTLSFMAPNHVAREEFIRAFFKDFLTDAPVKQLQSALSDLLDRPDPVIDPFLKVVEQSVLAAAQGRDALDQEQAIHKILFTCLTLCKRPTDLVVSEYLVKPNFAGAEDGCSVDIVYRSQSGDTKKRYVFEIKNVSVQHWKKKPTKWDWSDLVALAKTVSTHTREELLRLEWKPYGRGITSVQTTIDEASQQLKGYLTEMKQKDNDEGPCVGFVIVRVGLFRLVSHKV